MNNLMKIMCLVLAFAFVLPMALIACSNSKDTDTPATEEVLTILADGKSDYTIVRPDKITTVALDAVTTLRSAFTEKFGAEPDIESDWIRKGEEVPVGTKEILIGNTNRPESAKALEELKEEGFLIKVYGERIAIVASGDAFLVNAVEYFIKTYITPATDKVELSKDTVYVGSAAQYAPAVDNGDGTVTLKLKQFVVTYDSSNEQIFVPSVAKAFADRASELYGLVGVGEDEAENKYEILFGKCDREDFRTTDKKFLFRDYFLGYSNNKISVSAFSIYGYERAINFLMEGFEADGITIPKDGVYSEHDYGTGRYAEVYKNYENPTLEGTWMVSVCHRGDVITNKYPENSIPSYQSCIDNLVDVIETDLKKTKDDIWVICHDQKIDRTTTGKGTISAMTYTQTQKYYLRAQNGGGDAAATKYKMPTLEEIIDLCKGKCLFNLDHLDPSMFQSVYDVFEKKDAVEMAMFKTSGWKAEDLIKWFSELLEDGRELPLFSPLLYSNTQAGCKTFKGLTSMVETGRDHSTKVLDLILNDYNIRAMCLTALDMSRETIPYYTELKNKGYTAIMTDYPTLLKQFIHG